MSYGRKCDPNDEPNCSSSGLARPWILERRNGLARGIYNRLKEDDRSSGTQTVAEAQWRLDTLISGGGFSAYRMVSGSNPVDLFGWGDRDEDLTFAQDTSLSGQFAQQWGPRVMAHEAALKYVASRRPRQLLASDKSFAGTGVKIGNTVLSYKVPGKQSTLRRRGPALLSDMDEAGVTEA